ncbi:MAG: PqqD family protein [Melioribacteraceae bacterium]|jgi:hypothetical protein|nr:PqqD family protein [Melioribacteraceae bacterium]RJP59452.1 MAG: PqqD family protein [Ignavibacteriales bacterium]WKZ69624.1 MAG: PqqD family protein [Melioribacteraceae bacterium]WKZ69635.1 MAG: PqqD family protein [Melioribacteraceae bacterium]
MNRLNKLAVNSEGFIFDPTTGDSYTVNPTGLFIINSLREGKEIDQIAEELSKEFEETPEEISSDISDFITHLNTYNIY